MASITNKTPRDITLPSNHVVPARGTLDNLPNSILMSGDNEVKVRVLVYSGDLEISLDPEKVAEGDPVLVAPTATPHNLPLVDGPVDPKPSKTPK